MAVLPGSGPCDRWPAIFWASVAHHPKRICGSESKLSAHRTSNADQRGAGDERAPHCSGFEGDALGLMMFARPARCHPASQRSEASSTFRRDPRPSIVTQQGRRGTATINAQVGVFDGNREPKRFRLERRDHPSRMDRGLRDRPVRNAVEIDIERRRACFGTAAGGPLRERDIARQQRRGRRARQTECMFRPMAWLVRLLTPDQDDPQSGIPEDNSQ